MRLSALQIRRKSGWIFMENFDSYANSSSATGKNMLKSQEESRPFGTASEEDTVDWTG